ncbi:MAG: hypothetical protein IPL53_07900 [Ignavibacteria bacterium]|nr:hypothetical protein [Ignavibacteria bacterium]
MQKIKSSREAGNLTEMSDYRKQLNALQGVVSKRGEPVGYVRKGTGNTLRGDVNISVSPVFYGSNIQAITTVTEQRGNNAGRIWTIFSYNSSPAKTGASGTTSETRFFYSDDGGINWIDYAYAYNPYESAAADAIDAEIIEDFTGTKYLYVSYGAITNSGDKYICNLIVLTISGTVTGSVQRLEWPGFDYFTYDVNYFKPRITTDNAFWTGAPYLYIAACQDSSDEVDNLFSEKVAIITSPFDPNPVIEYKPDAFWYYSIIPAFQGNCDIAWFDDPGNGGGSVILVESGAFFNTAIYLYETPDVGWLGLPTYEGYLDPDFVPKSSAYVASNGLYQNLMIVNLSEYLPTDHDVQYFSTVDAGDTWSDGFVAYTGDDDSRADIVGLRNVPGNFYSAHANNSNTYNTVFYSTAINDQWGFQNSPMNNYDASTFAGPRPGIRLGYADSCFVVWSEYVNSNVHASAGCSGSPVDVSSLFVNVYVEGYYNPDDYIMTRNDTVTVTLRQAVSPFNIAESRKAVMNQYGNTIVNFSQIDKNTNYYVVINQRNTIETWSSDPINFFGGNFYYKDFIYNSSEAYGSNEKYLGTDPSTNNYYGMYSGDVTQNGFIDLTDVITVYFDANSFLTGYVSTDLNGDDIVDLTDLTIAYNNSVIFVSVKKP